MLSTKPVTTAVALVFAPSLLVNFADATTAAKFEKIIEIGVETPYVNV